MSEKSLDGGVLGGLGGATGLAKDAFFGLGLADWAFLSARTVGWLLACLDVRFGGYLLVLRWGLVDWVGDERLLVCLRIKSFAIDVLRIHLVCFPWFLIVHAVISLVQFLKLFKLPHFAFELGFGLLLIPWIQEIVFLDFIVLLGSILSTLDLGEASTLRIDPRGAFFLTHQQFWLLRWGLPREISKILLRQWFDFLRTIRGLFGRISDLFLDLSDQILKRIIVARFSFQVLVDARSDDMPRFSYLRLVLAWICLRMGFCISETIFLLQKVLNLLVFGRLVYLLELLRWLGSSRIARLHFSDLLWRFLKNGLWCHQISSLWTAIWGRDLSEIDLSRLRLILAWNKLNLEFLDRLWCLSWILTLAVTRSVRFERMARFPQEIFLFSQDPRHVMRLIAQRPLLTLGRRILGISMRHRCPSVALLLKLGETRPP